MVPPVHPFATLAATLLALAMPESAGGSSGPSAQHSAAASAARPNVLLLAVDDLRPQFGAVFGSTEVKTPHIDAFFLEQGTAMQRAYVQVAVCGPSRSSILTGRRPDTTWVNNVDLTGQGTKGIDWCWCQRGRFLTLPRYLRTHGYVTAGAGKIFHPDACGAGLYNNTHANGDDDGAWSEPYFTEPECEQWGSVPCPGSNGFDNGTLGPSYAESQLPDDNQTDGQLAVHAIGRLAAFAAAGVGTGRAGSPPFFHAVGFHKPHLPHIVHQRYFDLYPVDAVSLPPNRAVPVGFKEENWHANGNWVLQEFTNNEKWKKEGFGFSQPLDQNQTRLLRRGYFAAVSFVDAQVGRVLRSLEANGYVNNTIVALFGDHGWHLGDTNSWGKMTNFESAVRAPLLWRVPGQSTASRGRSARLVEMLDFYPTLVELAGLPGLPSCTGLDQPPSVHCLQGESYAGLFHAHPVQAAAAGGRAHTAAGGGGAVLTLPVGAGAGAGAAEPARGASTSARTPKQHAFSQWPYPVLPNITSVLRMGYTVRSSAGYRLTVYVPYLKGEHRGNWSDGCIGDRELYDYNADPWETTNRASWRNYSKVAADLLQVLVQQHTRSTAWQPR